MLCVPTIMHTGTHLISQEILNIQFRANVENALLIGVPPDVKLTADNQVYMGHLIDSYSDAWRNVIAQYPIITPLRHPARVLESFKRRGRDIGLYTQQWDNMIEIVAPNDPCYVHIDAPEVRDHQIAKIAKLVGRDIKTDWPINNLTGCRSGTHALEITSNLLKGVPQNYIDFYEVTLNAG